MTPEQFTAWRERHNLTKVQAAKTLGISLASVSIYERGSRYDGGRPVVIPMVVLLATEAVTHRLLS